MKDIIKAAEKYGLAFDIMETIDAPQATLYRIMPKPKPQVRKSAPRNTFVREITRNIKDIGVQLGKNVWVVSDNSKVYIAVEKEMRDYIEVTEDKFGDDIYLGRSFTSDVFVNFNEQPHMLIAGATGSGKSVLLRTILFQLMQRRDTLIAIIDPKRIDFSMLAGKNNIWRVINEVSIAEEFLDFMVMEMEERYEQMLENNGSMPGDMERIVIVIDEFADLVLQSKKIAPSMIRLAQMGRACDIHLIIATQRPDATIVSPLIKANFPLTIGLQTSTWANSRVIIDQNGCENLLGNGDAILTYGATIKRLQCAYVDDAVFNGILRDAWVDEYIGYNDVRHEEIKPESQSEFVTDSGKSDEENGCLTNVLTFIAYAIVAIANAA